MARRTHRHFSNRRPSLQSISQLLALVWGIDRLCLVASIWKTSAKNQPVGRRAAPGRGVFNGLTNQRPDPRLISLPSGASPPRNDSNGCHAPAGVAVLRWPAIYKKCGCPVSDDGSFSAHDVEISSASRIPGGAARCRSPVPNILSRRNLARPCAVCTAALKDTVHREGPSE